MGELTDNFPAIDNINAICIDLGELSTLSSVLVSEAVSGPQTMAAARVVSTCLAYFGLARKVISPSRASSIPATPVITIPP